LVVALACVAGTSAAQADEVFITLISSHIPWDYGYIIGGAHLVIEGGTIEAIRPTGNLISDWSQPDPATGVVTFSFLLHGLPPTREMQEVFLNRWLKVKTNHDGVSQLCPSDACPVKAHGALTLMKFYLTKHDPPVVYRDLQLTNADFLIVGAPE
jgi:hypothetical protein